MVVLFLWWRSRIFVYRKASSSTHCATSHFFERLFTASQVTRPALLSFFPNLGITKNVAGLFRFCA